MSVVETIAPSGNTVLKASTKGELEAELRTRGLQHTRVPDEWANYDPGPPEPEDPPDQRYFQIAVVQEELSGSGFFAVISKWAEEKDSESPSEP